ncbi:Histone-lysine N-methyltransferase SETMAR [Eumeta japonica]|uniref:Histone-lysine N-methyltransferase SETMAR n=1 Tax=Eumeta variegata TaxID=151549 RepID=A0A4C1VCH9_EUMVA|nr:Histone-lysine N-methyltransferase SETMAR [Eumeta japonica]
MSDIHINPKHRNDVAAHKTRLRKAKLCLRGPFRREAVGGRRRLPPPLHESVGIEILAHPPYSPDLAPCDFYLFSNIKEKLRGKWFMDAEKTVALYEKTVETTLKFE